MGRNLIYLVLAIVLVIAYFYRKFKKK